MNFSNILDWRLEQFFLKKRGDYFHRFASVRDGHPAGQLNVSFDSGKTQVKATIQADPKQAPPDWSASLNGLPLCGQFSAEKGRNTDVALVLEEFLEGERPLALWPVECGLPEKQSPSKGSLLLLMCTSQSPRVVRHWTFWLDCVCWNHRRWKTLGLYRVARGGSISREVFPWPPRKALKISSTDITSEQRHYLPSKWCGVATALPHTALAGGDATQQDQLLRDGYIPLINACRQHEAAKDDKQRQAAARNLHQGVAELFRLLVSHLTSKEGLIRHADWVGVWTGRLGWWSYPIHNFAGMKPCADRSSS